MSTEAVAQNGKDQESAIVSANEGDTAKLELYKPSPLPQNRPIERSHLNVVETYNTMGMRPVVSSGIEMSGSLAVSGNRPIVKSNLAISQTYSVMGNRPVAPNEIDDIGDLIGYLD
ncbi:MAG: hypothetical protein HC838_03295 [Spirulinaceae cyanobacterium RM2_2_10]|nr:hypothetical protein [Spirulinaceae cyanobacterium SM2_1_0]NJO19279.1 hypothetical protein [Spirulinaceae cyanobacterium RM2_2_10]